MLPVARGSLFITLQQLKKSWNWNSDTRVRTFLKVLAREGRIRVKTDAGKTHISLCNLEALQRADTAGNEEKTQAKRTKNAQKTPITPDHKVSKKQRMREDDSDFEGFQAWFENYPGSAHDNRDKADAEWRKLTPDERRKVIDETPGYFEHALEIGRNFPPAAANFLSGRYWERKRSKPQITRAKSTRLRQTGKKAPGLTVALTPKTREEILREHREHNAKSWDGQGRNLGLRPKFLDDYERRKAGHSDPESLADPCVTNQRSRLAKAS
jgi:hypothetical protein